MSPLVLSRRNRIPAEVELPVEAAPRHVGAGDVLERVVTDDVDDGADDRGAVLVDLVHERLEPALRALAVSVEERQRLRCGFCGSCSSNNTEYYLATGSYNFMVAHSLTFKTSPNKAFSLAHAHHMSGHRQLCDIFLQLPSKKVYNYKEKTVKKCEGKGQG